MDAQCDINNHKLATVELKLMTDGKFPVPVSGIRQQVQENRYRFPASGGSKRATDFW